MKKFCVYAHVFPNNKVYIGITCLKPSYRWNYGKGYKKQKLIYNAILKYGWDNIKHIVLFANLNETQAKELEIMLIKKYKANDPKYGYNQTQGGDGTLGLRLSQKRKDNIRKAKLGKPRSEETKKKISESEKGKKISKQQIEKRKATIKQKYPSGIKFSQEAKQKLSQRMKGNKYNVGIHRNKKYSEKVSIKVECIETGEIFSSILEASQQKNINMSNLQLASRGIRKTAGGFHWKRVD